MTDINTFSKETGARFRVTHIQSARITLTKLSEEERIKIAGYSEDQLETYFEVKPTKSGKRSGLITEIYKLLQRGWQPSDALTREAAFDQFVNNGGVEKVKAKPKFPELTVEFFKNPTLTVENYGELSFQATGKKHRFRMTPDQATQVESGQITREQAFTEFVNQKIAKEAFQQS